MNPTAGRLAENVVLGLMHYAKLLQEHQMSAE